jgi:hypothetical protein
VIRRQRPRRLDVVGCHVERPHGPGFRILKLSGGQQQCAGLDLCLGVVGQQVGRPHVLAQGLRRFIELQVGIGQLESDVAAVGIDLQCVAVLDRGFAQLLLSDERISLGRVFVSGGLAAATEQSGDKDQTGAGTNRERHGGR